MSLTPDKGDPDPKFCMNFRGQTMKQVGIWRAKVVMEAGNDRAVSFGSRNEKKPWLCSNTDSIRDI